MEEPGSSAVEAEQMRAADGRVPGRRGRATRQRLIECTREMLKTTSYRELKVVNLGAQVSVPQLVARAVDEKADAVLVSQVVTQRDAHLLNTREMSAAFREAYPADRRPLLIVGGPRFDETMSGELGVDRVFTRGTTPGEVASFLVHRLVDRKAS